MASQGWDRAKGQVPAAGSDGDPAVGLGKRSRVGRQGGHALAGSGAGPGPGAGAGPGGAAGAGTGPGAGPGAGPTVLLDLDGTVCELFAHTDLDPLRRRVADLLRGAGLGEFAGGDVFTAPARLWEGARGGVDEGGAGNPRHGEALEDLDELLDGLDGLLTEVEVEAAGTAPWVPGAPEVITDWVDRGVALALVTNNSPACVQRLTRRLPALGDVPVVGRDPRDPGRAKPSPRGILSALELLGVASPAGSGGGAGTGAEAGTGAGAGTEGASGVAEAVMVGDSLSDLAAARAAGCGFVGIASAPHRRERLGGVLPEGEIVVDFHGLESRIGSGRTVQALRGRRGDLTVRDPGSG